MITKMAAPEINYLADMDAELDAAAHPKKKTKAEKKAEKRELKRLAAIEEKKLVMRHGLKVELDLSKRMEIRGNEEWTDMCQMIRIVELREEIETWKKNSDRNMERKNETIQNFINDMNETNERQTRLFGVTLDIMEYVGACFNVLMDTTKQLYEMQSHALLTGYYDSLKSTSDEVDFMHEKTDNATMTMNQIVIDTIKSDYDIYLVRRDDLINTEIENRFYFRDQIVMKIKDMRRQLMDFIAQLRNTELDAQKYERIRYLTERQEYFDNEVRSACVEQMSYTAMISDIQKDLLNFEAQTSSTINDLKLELSYFNSVRLQLERSLVTDRKLTYNKLCILTNESYDVQKHFEKIAKKGELLLALSVSCRKLQTEKEKVVIGGETGDNYDYGDLNEYFKLKSLDLKKHLDVDENDIVEQSRMMMNTLHSISEVKYVKRVVNFRSYIYGKRGEL